MLLADGILSGARTIGDVFLLFYLARGVSWHTGHMLSRLSNVRRTIAATEHYLWLVDYAHDATAPGAAPALSAAEGLSFERVSFRYPGAERDVLDEVSFELDPGSTLAVVGDNGAGKTTLVKLLCRFYEPTGGRITFGGTPLAGLSVEEWRMELSACFQDFAQFEFRVRETVGLGSIGDLGDERRVASVINEAGGSDVIAGLPAGLEAQLGSSWDDGVDLSIGQWQKLALARAMMHPRPALLLLDEPTSALDARTEAALFERFRAASKFARDRRGITVIVSHRLSTVRMADRILVLDSGRVAEYGTHHELLERRGLYSQLYAIQASAYEVPSPRPSPAT